MDSRRLSAVIGAAALAALLAVGYVMALFLGGRFQPGYEVSAQFSRAGQLLIAGSDVKLRGVLVGLVSRIDVEPDGRARISMLLDTEQEIPANVHAAVRAKTLFGEKFIELSLPDDPSSQLLRPGDEIPEDRTVGPFEVETILERGVPILEAIDPLAFGAALNALARGLVGNEEALRRATLQSERLLTETERTLPHLERNLVHLSNFASALDQTDTDLLRALEGLTAVGEVLRKHPEAFRRTVSGLVPLSRDLGDILTERRQDLADIALMGRAVLESVEARAPDLPALVEVLDGFLGVWVADLSEGPFWRIHATDPPILLGEPYEPGTEPAPRSAALRRLASGAGPAAPGLLDMLLAPVPTDRLGGRPVAPDVSIRLGIRR